MSSARVSRGLALGGRRTQQAEGPIDSGDDHGQLRREGAEQRGSRRDPPDAEEEPVDAETASELLSTGDGHGPRRLGCRARERGGPWRRASPLRTCRRLHRAEGSAGSKEIKQPSAFSLRRDSMTEPWGRRTSLLPCCSAHPASSRIGRYRLRYARSKGLQGGQRGQVRYASRQTRRVART